MSVMTDDDMIAVLEAETPGYEAALVAGLAAFFDRLRERTGCPNVDLWSMATSRSGDVRQAYGRLMAIRAAATMVAWNCMVPLRTPDRRGQGN